MQDESVHSSTRPRVNRAICTHEIEDEANLDQNRHWRRTQNNDLSVWREMRDLHQQIDEIKQRKQSSMNLSIIQGSPFTIDIATTKVPKKI